MATLDIPSLGRGLVGITPAFGTCLAEAASVCLEDQGHSTGANMGVDGDIAQIFQVSWGSTDDRMRACWNDEEVATEHGAYGIAALLIRALTPFTIVQRSRKRTGFDWWLNDPNESSPQPLFQGKARLEVSGIRRGSESLVGGRVRQKLSQLGPANGGLPGYVIVVEFGTPRSRMRVA
jgi:hypothetical protein